MGIDITVLNLLLLCVSGDVLQRHRDFSIEHLWHGIIGFSVQVKISMQH